MTLCYIALGSNLGNQTGDSIAILRQAVQDLRLIGQKIQVSALYHTRPMGPQDQPDYWNTVVALETNLSPFALLDYLQVCEQRAGRVRLRHWGERTLDLDIILYGNESIQSPRLIVPHQGMLERDFVLIPLLDLMPNIPQLNIILGQNIQQSAVVLHSPLQPYLPNNWVDIGK